MTYHGYGSPDVLRLEDIPKPTATDDQILIKVHATTVGTWDCECRSFTFPLWFWLPLRLVMGVRKPRWPVLGQELAGEIEAVGKNVKRFKKGDQVFASTGLGFGAHAEYACLPSSGAIAIKPANMGYDEAAGIPTGGDNALHFLRKVDIRNGQRVLVNGAGGNIGVVAVQLAKHFGAEVTAVDSADKLDMLSEIGADHVIDYTKEDFTDAGETYAAWGYSLRGLCRVSPGELSRALCGSPALLERDVHPKNSYIGTNGVVAVRLARPDVRTTAPANEVERRIPIHANVLHKQLRRR